MKIRLIKLTAVALLFALMPMAVNAVPIEDTATGHFYEAILSNGISWEDARDAAESLSHSGKDGHLATITSSAENSFIISNLDTLGGELWLGGFQDVSSCPPTPPLPAPEPDPGCGWQWINGEGGFPGDNLGPIYANWSGSEPNDIVRTDTATTTAHEDHLGIFLGGAASWNDEGAFANIKGYIVEFGGTVDESDCDPGPCNPSGGMDLDTSGAGGLPNDATITQTLAVPTDASAICTGLVAYEDPRVTTMGRVDVVRELDVFDELGGGTPGAFILDDSTYGSPCFAVVVGSASDDFTSGVVRNELRPELLLPGIGQIFSCFDTGSQPDLQLVPEFTYQTTDKDDMIAGGAEVMTERCNSPSRGGSFRFSFYGINLHEDCGIDFNVLGGPAAILQCFTDLATAKFDALGESLSNAKKELIDPKYGKLRSAFVKARNRFRQGKYNKSLDELDTLLGRVEGGEFSGNFNHGGNLIMRIENLLYRVENIRASEASF